MNELVVYQSDAQASHRPPLMRCVWGCFFNGKPKELCWYSILLGAREDTAGSWSEGVLDVIWGQGASTSCCFNNDFGCWGWLDTAGCCASQISGLYKEGCTRGPAQREPPSLAEPSSDSRKRNQYPQNPGIWVTHIWSPTARRYSLWEECQTKQKKVWDFFHKREEWVLWQLYQQLYITLCHAVDRKSYRF